LIAETRRWQRNCKRSSRNISSNRKFQNLQLHFNAHQQAA
jgi:hypothetical protein